MVGKEVLTEKKLGVSNEQIESYIERDNKDTKFKSGLDTNNI